MSNLQLSDSPKRNSPWWIRTTLILAGLALFLWLAMAMPVARFPVKVLQLTNDPRQGWLATFLVTNESRLIIDYWICSPQVKSNGLWPVVQEPAWTASLRLAPGEANTFSVAAPATAMEWREPVRWGYRPTTKVRRWVGRLKSNFRLNWYLLRHGKRLRYNQGVEFDLFMSYSAAIEK
ncbi:MAG: hypothetical protein ACLQVY_11230 [Limisphaerales bacterium]